MSRESGVLKAWEATMRKTQAAKKRAHSIFGTTSVAHADDSDIDCLEAVDSEVNLGEVYHADRILPNGDYYTGQWCDNFPHGHGKYLWTDGCMYVGEWSKGKTMGRGRFSWPSGATYEGEFKSGYMDGIGTYTGSNGDTYKGSWVMNLKHGHGIKSFSNGDCYDGEWRRGSQEGNGRYQWKNGNHYVGEWKNGDICGKGIFVWSNGNKYEGNWETGLPRGNGTFKWPDGSFYVGYWSKDPEEQNGSYYPSGSSGNVQWDPQDVYNVDFSDCKICLGEKVSILPSQKKLAVWRSSKGEEGVKPRRMSVDGRVSIEVEKPFDRMQMWGGGEGDDFASGCCSERTSSVGGGGGGRGDVVDYMLGLNLDKEAPGMPMKMPRSSKRQGEAICKGHKNYDLMLNLQLGIR